MSTKCQQNSTDKRQTLSPKSGSLTRTVFVIKGVCAQWHPDVPVLINASTCPFSALLYFCNTNVLFVVTCHFSLPFHSGRRQGAHKEPFITWAWVYWWVLTTEICEISTFDPLHVQWLMVAPNPIVVTPKRGQKMNQGGQKNNISDTQTYDYICFSCELLYFLLVFFYLNFQYLYV